jgi:signal transduction histidine kinase/ligand-binding sensor domain-containing protein
VPSFRHFSPWLRVFVLLAGGFATGFPGRGAGEAPSAAQYSMREWHAQDGLPSEDVTRVHQDSAGYLWMATSRGLARFDGVHFENLGPALKRAGADANIRAIAEAAGIGLVVAPISGGTMVFKNGTFHPLPFAADKVINALWAEPNGTLWASCDDQSLLRWHGGATEEFRPNENSPHRLVAHFAMDPAGRTWVAGGTMIGRYEAGAFRVVNSEFSGPEFRVAASRTDGPWILTVDRLLKMGPHGVQEVLKDIPPLLGAHYGSLHEDRQGTLWIGTRSQGLYAVIEGRLRPVPTSGEAIAGICEDTEGDIWVACNGGGLNRFRYRDFKIYDRSAGLGDNYSFTVSEDADGSMWFGNRDGGAARLRNGQIDRFTNWPGQPNSSVSSVLPDGRGKIWVTTGNGVYKIDPAAGDRVERIEAIPPKPSIGVAFVATNGDYWVGINPDRVGRYRDGKLETFGVADGYDAKAPRAFAEDQTGGILIGSADGRLVRFDGRKFTRIPLDVKEDADAPIQDIYAEPDTGLTWVATSGNGLYVLGAGRFHQLTAADGLIDSNITAIIPDNEGYLWFGSAAGIFSLRRQELTELLDGRIARLHPVIVGRDDGVHGLTCLGLYKPSAWKGRDGRLWFATRKGVVNFDPAKAIADTASPPAFVAAVKCDDESRPFSAGAPFELSARVRKLELRLSVLCLSAPDRVQIRHRLDGFDSEWITAAPNRIVTYPRLAPGTYRLRTMSSLGNGVWNETESALVITVVPLWWQTLWFQLAVALAFVALVVVVVRLVSHRRLRSRLERLERESAIERERARIARNIHDDLGASLTRISLLTQTAKRDSTAPGAPQLGQIYETVRQITRSMDEIVWAVNPKNDHLDGLVSYLVSYAQGFLSVAGIRCRLDLPDQLPHAALTSQVRHNLYLCVKEALNNIVKHSGADEVTIGMRVAAESFTITISDNGRVAPRNHDGANGHATGNGTHHDVRVTPGQGLANITQRVADMDGTCEFTPPAAGQGARLAITLRLDPPPATPRLPANLFRPTTP